ncbi:MAG: hypothetical protein QM756_07885 [Polyangiaceae bacterium]
MARVPVQTSTLGWLGPPAGAAERGFDVQKSDNWPIPLIVRRDTGWRELSADWFGANERPSRVRTSELPESAPTPYQLVSRRRLRLAHALFVVLFLGLLALVAWEVRVYFGDAAILRFIERIRALFT